MSETATVSPQQALAVYAEPLVAGRRVVVFGEPNTGVAERLTELGARTVVDVAPGEDASDLRPATFDLALVPDLGVFDDAATVLAVVRRVVGENGAALVAAAAGAIDYYELFDLVAREFVEVRMIAQVPFHGVTLAELGTEDESPAVSVDTQLVGEAREPDVFVALASQRGASLDPYAIVGLPAPEAPAVDTRALEAAGALLAQEQLRSAAFEAEMDALRAQATQAVERAAQLERELAARAGQLAELSSEVEERRAAAEAGRIAAVQVEELARRADRAEQALSRVEPELARVAEGHAEELAQLEAALRDRAQAIRTLEEEVARRERMVHELVGALEERPAEPPPDLAGVPSEGPPVVDDSALRERLDALALSLARREGEAQAAAWTIAELERRLAGAQGGTNEQQRLAAALDELDALRRAFAQEHEQRVRAEAALNKAAAGEGPRNDRGTAGVG
jgi:hypothetical protein